LKSVDEIVDQCYEAGTLAEAKIKMQNQNHVHRVPRLGRSPRLAWQASITRVASEHEVLLAEAKSKCKIKIMSIACLDWAGHRGSRASEHHSRGKRA
jgi:hypothetical protein